MNYTYGERIRIAPAASWKFLRDDEPVILMGLFSRNLAGFQGPWHQPRGKVYDEAVDKHFDRDIDRM
jgi:hypothetical protein